MVNFIILFLTLDPHPSVIQGSRVNINDLMKVMKEKGSAKKRKEGLRDVRIISLKETCRIVFNQFK